MHLIASNTDKKNNRDQMDSWETGVFRCHESPIQGHLEPPVHHSTIVLKYLKGSPILARDAILSGSQFNFFFGPPTILELLTQSTLQNQDSTKSKVPPDNNRGIITFQWSEGTQTCPSKRIQKPWKDPDAIVDTSIFQSRYLLQSVWYSLSVLYSSRGYKSIQSIMEPVLRWSFYNDTTALSRESIKKLHK